jgi:hypothetical protein
LVLLFIKTYQTKIINMISAKKILNFLINLI